MKKKGWGWGWGHAIIAQPCFEYGDGCAQTHEAGVGFLRLHSTYRHDLKIYSSNEGRVQMTAAAFTKGLLDLEGSLTPILVSETRGAAVLHTWHIAVLVSTVGKVHRLMKLGTPRAFTRPKVSLVNNGEDAVSMLDDTPSEVVNGLTKAKEMCHAFITASVTYNSEQI